MSMNELSESLQKTLISVKMAELFKFEKRHISKLTLYMHNFPQIFFIELLLLINFVLPYLVKYSFFRPLNLKYAEQF